MILLVFVARVADSLLLVASTDQMRSSDSQDTMDVYKSQARQILRKLDARSPARCSIESGPYTFHYVISECCCYLAMTHRSYPKRLIFQYLEEIARDFAEEVARDCGGDWRSAVETVGRPYAFITAWKPNLRPDFNLRVCDRFDASSSAVLRELEKSSRFVQKPAKLTSI